MSPIKNCVAFVKSISKGGYVFAQAWHEKKMIEIVITPPTAHRASKKVEVEDRIVVDVMPSVSEEHGHQLLGVTIHSVAAAGEYKGPARVKWFHMDKMFGAAVIETVDGPVEAFISSDLVNETGWVPGSGTHLEVEAYEGPRGWTVDSYILVEKRAAA